MDSNDKGQEKVLGELTWEEFYETNDKIWFASKEMLHSYEELFDRYKKKYGTQTQNPIEEDRRFWEKHTVNLFPELSINDKLKAWDLMLATNYSFVTLFDRFFFCKKKQKNKIITNKINTITRKIHKKIKQHL